MLKLLWVYDKPFFSTKPYGCLVQQARKEMHDLGPCLELLEMVDGKMRSETCKHQMFEQSL